MRALVTGSSGFIGSNLVAALLERGDTVRCLVRRANPPAAAGLRATHHLVDYSRADLGCSPEVFADIDLVFHVAGQTNAVTAADFRRANVQPLENVLAALIASGARPNRLVLISSLAAAGPAPSLDRPVTETMPSAPIEPYGASKRAAELVLAARGTGIPFTILRPAATYGQGDRGFLQIFKMVRHGMAIYPAVRDHWLSAIAIDDLIAGILSASSTPGTVGRTFFLAHPTPHRWRDIYRAAGVAMGRTELFEINLPSSVVWTAALGGDLWALATKRTGLLNRNKIALGMPRFWVCSSDLAVQEFGFQPITDFRQGMRRTYEWYRRHRWL